MSTQTVSAPTTLQILKQNSGNPSASSRNSVAGMWESALEPDPVRTKEEFGAAQAAAAAARLAHALQRQRPAAPFCSRCVRGRLDGRQLSLAEHLRMDARREGVDMKE